MWQQVDSRAYSPFIIVFVLILNYVTLPVLSSQACERGEIVGRNYILYDLNHAEGFNLRRDVYIRIAVFVKKLQQSGDWVLVLPPWGPLPHWKSKDVGEQVRLPWKKFFNTDSLKKYVPVVELSDLLAEKKNIVINQLIYLQHFRDAWEGGKWEEKYKFEDCHQHNNYRPSLKDSLIKGWFWGYDKIQARNFSCLSFQGHYQKLLPILTQDSKSTSGHIVMIDRGEIPLHDEYGGVEYWKVRRSMRFAPHLYSLANEFRRASLQSDDETDDTVLPLDWRDETLKSGETIKGGNYVCGHLRRQDFLYGRAKDIPSLKTAAKKLERIARSLNIRNIFIASDGTKKELEELQRYVSSGYRLIFYQPSFETRREILDGGVAIVEQIVCSRARYFIGSFESTFSFRIQEEREILGFPSDSTFNRFCADGVDSCEQPAKWKMVM